MRPILTTVSTLALGVALGAIAFARAVADVLEAIDEEEASP